ncbi:MAG: hypothetical protein M3279_10580 [Actinomycetota bacterium]|nr:hypothetical protein [Actinomycetota bacterium]
MKKTLAVVALGVCVMLAAGAVMPAISQPPEQRTTLTWFDPNKTDFEKGMNLGGKGFAGDMSVIKDSMFDPETCDKVATLLLRFQGVKAAGRNDGFFLADGGLLLPDGKISIYLPGRFSDFEDEGGAAGAVTGGTGAYRDVTGEFHVVEDQQMCDRRGALITADVVLE